MLKLMLFEWDEFWFLHTFAGAHSRMRQWDGLKVHDVLLRFSVFSVFKKFRFSLLILARKKYSFFYIFGVQVSVQFSLLNNFYFTNGELIQNAPFSLVIF